MTPEEKRERQRIASANFRARNLERLRENDRARYWADVEKSRAEQRDKRAKDPKRHDAVSAEAKKRNPEKKTCVR